MSGHLFINPQNASTLHGVIKEWLQTKHGMKIGNVYAKDLTEIMKYVFNESEIERQNNPEASLPPPEYKKKLNKRTIEAAVSYIMDKEARKREAYQQGHTNQQFKSHQPPTQRDIQMAAVESHNRGDMPYQQGHTNQSFQPPPEQLIPITYAEKRNLDAGHTNQAFMTPRPDPIDPDRSNVNERFEQTSNSRNAENRQRPRSMPPAINEPIETSITPDQANKLHAHMLKQRMVVDQFFEDNRDTIEHIQHSNAELLIPDDTSTTGATTTSGSVVESFEQRSSQPSLTEKMIHEQSAVMPKNMTDIDPKTFYSTPAFGDSADRPTPGTEIPGQGLDSFFKGPIVDHIPKYSKNNVSESMRIPQKIVIDSRDRNHGAYPDSFNFRVDLSNEYRNVVSVELISAEIPRTDYTINETNNTLYFEETGGTTLTATIATGTYLTASSLATAIKSALDTAGTSTYTVTPNSATSTFTIASDGGGGAGIFNLLFLDPVEVPVGDNGTEPVYRQNSAGPVIGFNRTDLSGSLTYTGTFRYNLSGDPYVLLECDELPQLETNSVQASKVFAKIPFEGLTTLDFFSDNFRNIKHFSPPLARLNHLTFRFKRYDGSYYNFRGHDACMTLEIISQSDYKRTV